ncbi:uncharacterized protein LOC100201500 [Hydra vulgaris]|uniref:Uncharacterized protein LOC100201500 n=1 Tax=Hydra vulgaris TaxID=6087 RepID=A0ABM4BCM8_HYDVU
MKNSAGTQTDDFVCFCTNQIYICFEDIKLIDISMVVQLDGVSENGVFVARNFEGESTQASKNVLRVLRGVLKRKSIFKMTPSKMLPKDVSLTDYQEPIILKSGIYMRKVTGDIEKFFRSKCFLECIGIADNKSNPEKNNSVIEKVKEENKKYESSSKNFEEQKNSSPASDPVSDQTHAQVIYHEHPLINSKLPFLSAQNQASERNCSQNKFGNLEKVPVVLESKECLREEPIFPFYNKKTETSKTTFNQENFQAKNNIIEHKVLSSEPYNHATILSKNGRQRIDLSKHSKKQQRNSKEYHPIFYSSPLIRKHFNPQQSSPVKNKMQKPFSQKAVPQNNLRRNGSLHSLMSLSFNESDDDFMTSSPLISPKAQINEHACNGVFTYV